MAKILSPASACALQRDEIRLRSYRPRRAPRDGGHSLSLSACCGIVVDGADIGGDVLARRAVAARRRLHQFAVLVAQRHRQPVDLRLGGEDERSSSAPSFRKRRTRSTKSATSSSVKALASDSIGTACCTLAKPRAGAAPTRLRRRACGRPGPESAPRSLRCAAAAHRIRRLRSSARPSGNSARCALRSQAQAA